MTPSRAVEVLIEAGLIPPERRSSATAVLHAADASFDFDELEPRVAISPRADTLPAPPPEEDDGG